MKRLRASRWLGMVLAGALAAGPALADPAREAGASDQPADKLELLIKQLGDRSWKVRQQAQDRLVHLGFDIRPQLQESLKSAGDEEMRTRLEATIRQIDENRASGTSIITIHLKQAQPKDVIAELSKQAGTVLRTLPVNLWESRTFEAKDIDIEHQPFWEALKVVCTAWGLSPQQSGMDRDMFITDRNLGLRAFGEAPSVISGPFLVTAMNINRNHNVDLNHPKDIRRMCTVQMSVLVEPKIKVLQGTYAAKVEQAVDEKGNVMAGPANNAMQTVMSPGNTWVWSMSCNLVPQAGAGERIAILKGHGTFMVQARSETIEIPEVLSAKNVSRSVAGKRFVLKDVRKTTENMYEASITLYRSGVNPAEWSFMANHAFKLVDAKGNALMRTGPNITGSTPDATEMKFVFNRNLWNNGEIAGEPVKLVWEVPTETREVVVPFEFRDLPLP